MSNIFTSKEKVKMVVILDKQWREQTTLLLSISKWTIYASGVGVIVGVCTWMFLSILKLAITLAQSSPQPLYLAPVLLLVSKLLVDKLAPEAAGYGTDRIIAAVHDKNGRIPIMVVPVKLLASVLTIAGGGSAGKVGPCGQIGAGMASAVADVLRIDDTDRKKLVICGISAGFAAVFGTPIGGAVFGVEVLFLGKLLYEMLFPAFVAGITAFHVAKMLGVSSFGRSVALIPDFSEWMLVKCIFLGIVSGLVALLFIRNLDIVKGKFSVWSHSLVAPIVGGIILILCGFAISPAYLGLGVEVVEQCLSGGVLPVYAFFLKIITTSVTFAAGGSGGIILPSVFIGATVGNAFGQLVGSSFLGSYSAIGMVALLAAVANTPIAASIMAIELFGPEIAPYAAVTCIVSYLIVGHHSVFPTQVLVIKKSASIQVDTGKPVSDVHDIQFKPHGSFWGKLLRWHGCGNDDYPSNKNKLS